MVLLSAERKTENIGNDLLNGPIQKFIHQRLCALMSAEFIFPLQLKLRAGEYVVYDEIPTVQLDYGYSPGYLLVTNYRVVYLPFLRSDSVCLITT